MRYLIVLFLLVGCAPPIPGENGKLLPDGVNKFQDGNVVCYMYYDHGISCVRVAK